MWVFRNEIRFLLSRSSHELLKMMTISDWKLLLDVNQVTFVLAFCGDHGHGPLIFVWKGRFDS